MKTTTVDYASTVCNRCSGKGYIAQYQHIKGGECFSCGATGKGQPVPFEREMTYAEIVAALESKGINIIPVQNDDDWLQALFISDEAVAGARLLLQAV